MTQQSVHVNVITCPGRLGDEFFRALEIAINGMTTPLHMLFALPAVSCRALSQQVDPAKLYDAMAKAINESRMMIEVH